MERLVVRRAVRTLEPVKRRTGSAAQPLRVTWVRECPDWIESGEAAEELAGIEFASTRGSSGRRMPLSDPGLTRADVVHVDHQWSRSVRRLRRLAPAAAVVLDFTGLPEGVAFSAARRAKNADLLLFPSLRDLSEARRRFPSIVARSTLLRPPVTHVATGSAGVPLEWQDGLPLVLYDGPLTAAGGLDAALEAVRTLLEGSLEVRFVAVGRGDADRRYLERCRLLAAPLADRLLVLEDTSARTVISSWYERADVVCLPARSAVDPMPAKLAAVSATPIIATEVESVLEYVDDETGVLLPVDDPVALYTGLLRVVRDRALADRLAATASRRADRELSCRTAARRLVELWTSAVTRVADLDGVGAATPPVAAGARGR